MRRKERRGGRSDEESETRPGGQRCVLKPLFHFSFFYNFFIFHFFTTFSFFHSPRRSFLLVAPSSSSLLPPRPSFLLVPPSSLFLFLPRPALSQSLRIHKRPFFIEFDESVTDRPTDGPTNRRTNGRTRPLIEMRGRI